MKTMRILIFFLLLGICKGHPLGLGAKRNTPFDVDVYLEKYGYLSPLTNTSEGNKAHSEYSRSHAISLFQAFAHLPPSGMINKETIEAMQRPRCGFPDILSNTTDTESPLNFIAEPKWKNKTVTWKISSYTDKLTVTEQRIAIENGFQRWENVSGLRFIETNDTANINILFASGFHGDGIKNAFDGAGGVLAHAFLPEDGRTHFDDDEFWVFHETEGAEIEMIATHELGHSLGLTHSVVRGALMAPFYQQYSDNFTLHADDIAGIQNLYGAPEDADRFVSEHLNGGKTPTPRSDIILTNVTAELPVVTRPQIFNKTTTSHPGITTTAIPGPEIFTTVTHPGPMTTVKTTDKPKVKDERLCETKIDAAIPGEPGTIRLFIGKYIYKIYENCNVTGECVVDGYPKKIRTDFKKGPKRVKTAAFLPDERQRTYLFKGRKVWRYSGTKLDKGYPKQMDKVDLPHKPNAAFIQKNHFADYQFYIFAGKYFWELNLYTDTITNDVFKIKTYWDYLPTKPDAMLQTKGGMIYVFKGKYFNKYDHRRVLLERKKSIASDLLGAVCM